MKRTGTRYWVRSKKCLTMYSEGVSEQYWANRWSVEQLDELVLEQKTNKQILVNAFQRYLPRDGRILEAGCGLGTWVKILLADGYNIEGIDFSKETISQAKTYDPALPVNEGNVLKLDYPDEYFDAYISLGVVEHFKDGPLGLLVEAYRVLKPGGIMMISFPHYNPLRKMTVFRRKLDEKRTNRFFQYAFTAKDFRKILKEQGFFQLARVPYSTRYIKREMPLVSNILLKTNRPQATAFKDDTSVEGVKSEGNKLKAFIKKLVSSYPVMYVLGHTMMLVVKKN